MFFEVAIFALAVSSILVFCFGVPLVFALLSKRRRRRRVIVIVFGDVGRSPRTMHHAVGFARHGIPVTLVGYFPTGRKGLPKEVAESELIELARLPIFTCPWSR